MIEKSWHALSAQDCLKELRSAPAGLGSAEAKDRLKEYGFNELIQRKRESAWKLLIAQFANFLVGILIFAMVVSVLVGEWLDAIVIGFIVVLNAGLGFFQEFKAEKSMEALQKMQADRAKAFRDGSLVVVPARELVPGDVIEIDEGDKIPADARILDSVNCATQEAALTGESTPIEKIAQPLMDARSVAEQKNMVFLNTVCVRGRAKAIVVGTGMRSEFGKIAHALQEIPRESTPLTKKLDVVGKTIGWAVIAIAIALFAVIVLWHEASVYDAMLTSISLAVAAIPEGLPAIVTITLAFGLNEMAKHNAIIRRITAVETLGSTNVICSDKTGTLTQNKMSAKRALVGKTWIELNHALRENDRLIVACATYCNAATLGKEGKESLGDPTEIALLEWGKQNGLFQETRGTLLKEFSFDSDRKRMSVIIAEEKKTTVYCKGAAEGLLSLSSNYWDNGKIKKLGPADKRFFSEQVNRASGQGLRVIAFASKEWKGGKNISVESAESDLVFLGFVGLLDDLRPEAKKAVELCQTAGIEVKMLTGDHPLTAKAIAVDLGFMKPGENVVLGQSLESLNEVQRDALILESRVFARVSPQHKLWIVESLQRSKKIVAVTGDGVNDALALKKANIGIAMGITGTDVAKEASDMIVTDDNFASIVRAVQEGRKIYANIQNFVKYLLAANTGEVLFVASTSLAGMPLPLIPLQILWINIVTDGLPALALGKEDLGAESMKRPPRKQSESILAPVIPFVVASGLLLVVVAMAGFLLYLPAGLEKARTVAFSIIILFELFLVFDTRSEKSAFEANPLSNIPLVLAVLASLLMFLAVLYVPFLAGVFRVVELNALDWLIVIALGATALSATYLERFLKKHFPKREAI